MQLLLVLPLLVVLIFVIFIISLVGCTKTGPDDIEKIQNQFSGVFYAKVEYVTPSISSIRLDTTIEIKEDKFKLNKELQSLNIPVIIVTLLVINPLNWKNPKVRKTYL